VIHTLSAGEKIWDVCVVGTGPVGMALALELERRGREVLLLESGGMEREAAGSAASHAEILSPATQAPMEIAVVRALGGTSWTWGGRCVAYDDVDWMPRGFVFAPRWPVTQAEIEPYYTRAAEYLLCGSDAFAVPYRRALSHGLTLEGVERWASEARVILRHREKLLASEKIKISLQSTVTALNLSADGSAVESLALRTPDGERLVQARRFVLAMGGVESTRLLLAAQQRWPGHFGGVDGPLGRYYMGHISGKIASIQFDDSVTADDLDFKLDGSAHYRRRLMLTAETQVQHGLLNTAFWPDNPPFYDPAHRSGVLSAVFLALAVPPIGRRLLPEGIRLAHTGPKPYPWAAHLRNAVLGAPRGSMDMYKILRDRFIQKPKKPGFLVTNSGGKYALHYHGEQIPQAESRITLSREVDEFGMPRAVIDLRFAQQDVDSAIASHRVLDEALRANKIGRLEYWYPAAELDAKVWEQAADGFHQVGTTRMGSEPAGSVVDGHLRTHGVGNLFVASSSVFPVSGQANSTLLAVAFGVRLAERLAR
jgi:choline dehydrogenase-like flavoprotein